MIRIDDADRITWERVDVYGMAAIIGPEMAAIKRKKRKKGQPKEPRRGRCPYSPAILKLAKKKGLILSPKARAILRREEQLRERIAKLDGKTFGSIDELDQKAKPHQRWALKFFARMNMPSYLVADKTGVGKTLQFLIWAQRHAADQAKLVITTNGAKRQWRDAVRHFIDADARVRIVSGSIKKQRSILRRRVAGWVVAHWESLVHARDEYTAAPWGVIGLDEAHKINNRNAQRSEVAAEMESPHIMAMTAHPFSKHVGELFSILRVLYPQRYTSYWRFFFMYVEAEPKPFGGYNIIGTRHRKILKWELAPFTIERTKQQVFKSLPRVSYAKRTVQLTRRGEREYRELQRKLFAELDAMHGKKVIPIINDFVRLTRIRQYLIDPGLIGGKEKSVKYPEMLEVMEEVGDPIVIFSSFREATHAFGLYARRKAGLRHGDIGFIDGGVSESKREVYKKRFLRGDLRCLLVVGAAGGESLNLGKYGYVAHLDLPFTPRDYEQQVGRVDRPEENTGHLVPTTGYRVVVEGTYEERLEGKLNHRHREFTGVFTADKLRNLFIR
jgi:SNF2 family DNA or RNA helicase